MPGFDDVRRGLQNLAPQAARVLLVSLTGGSLRDDPVTLIRAAIARLPGAGRIQKKKDQAAVIALTHLLSEVPANTPGYADLVRAVGDLRDRAVR